MGTILIVDIVDRSIEALKIMIVASSSSSSSVYPEMIHDAFHGFAHE